MGLLDPVNAVQSLAEAVRCPDGASLGARAHEVGRWALLGATARGAWLTRKEGYEMAFRQVTRQADPE